MQDCFPISKQLYSAKRNSYSYMEHIKSSGSAKMYQ